MKKYIYWSPIGVGNPNREDWEVYKIIDETKRGFVVERISNNHGPKDAPILNKYVSRDDILNNPDFIIE